MLRVVKAAPPRAPRLGRLLRWLVMVAWTLAPVASAAEPPASARNTAELLFLEGRRLMAAGKNAEACPKLAESQRLDSGGGTMLNLAICHEALGLYASARAEFREALGMARRDGRYDREQIAMDFLQAIDPKVSYVIFAAEETAKVPGLVVRLDEAELGRAVWENPLPVDPGPHQIALSAPGKRPRNLTVTVGRVGDQQTITIPVLLDAPVSRPTASSSAAPSSTPHHGTKPSTDSQSHVPNRDQNTRNVGLVLLGGSALAVGVGTALGLEALSKRKESDSYCIGSVCADRRGIALNNDAQRLAAYADIAFVAALTAGVVGAYLTLHGASPASLPASATSKGTPGRSLRITASIAPVQGGWVGLAGSW